MSLLTLFRVTAEYNMATASETASKLTALKKIKNLGLSKDNERNKAINLLITFVKSRQNTSSKGILPDTAFVVKKLIQGLSDDKEHQRVGYSTALCQLLRSFDCIESSFILSYIEENFESTLKIVDTINREIGRVLGWITLINSTRLKTFSAKEIDILINNLLNSKPYVKLLCLTGLTDIISQVSHKVFQQNVLPHLEKQLRTGWEDCTPNIFTLLLFATKYHSSALKEIIKKHWQNDRLVSEENYSHIVDLLGKCSSCKDAVHPLIDLVLSIVKEKGLCVVKFWKEIGNPILTSKINRGGKLVLGLDILNRLLPEIQSADKQLDVINSDVATALVACTATKADKLSKAAAEKLVEQLTKYAAKCNDMNTEVRVVKCLVPSAQAPTMINAFNALTKQISPAGRAVFVEEILKTLAGKSSWLLSDPKQSINVVKQWCLRQLNCLCNVVEPTQHLSILQFLFLHSFFVVKKTHKDISHCVVLTTDLSEFDRKMMTDTCFKLLSRLLTRRDIGVPKVKNLNQHLDVLFKLAQYVHTLIQSTGSVELVNENATVQVQKEWNKLWDVIKFIHSKRKDDEISDSHSFELLFICCGLQLLAETESIQETLQDLYVCHEKSKKRRKSLASTDGPAWIDVIVELMLSMVFNDNFLSRVVAKQVMSYLTDHVTPSSVQLLVDALEQTSAGDDGEMIGVDNENDDEEEMNSDDENGAMEVDEDSENEEENGDVDEEKEDDEDDDEDDDDDDDSDDSGIEEENDVDVSDGLKEKVKAALGNAAALSDDDDGSEEENDVEFSDSEMFKLDKVLASAFKSMTKGKKSEKEREHQLTSFKTRVLDLVEVVIKGSDTPATSTAFILPLFHLIEKGMKKVSDETLGKKADFVLGVLLKQKLARTVETVDKDEWIDLLEELMKYSKKVPIHSFVQNVGKAYLHVMKIVLSDDGVSPLRTRSKPVHKPKTAAFYQEKVVAMVKTAILELLEHKPGHGPPAFFHIILTKYPILFWELNEVFLNTVDSSDVKVYSRTQAAAFLADIVTEQTGDTGDPEAWNVFVSKWKSTAHKVIVEESKGQKLAKGFMNEVVSLSYHLRTAYPELKVLSEGDLHTLLAIRQKCDKIAKSVIGKLTKDLKGASNEPKRKKEKKRKHNDNKDEIDGTSPVKKTKNVNQSEEPIVNQSSEKSKNINQTGQENHDGAVDSATVENTPKRNKKKKHKNKTEHSAMNNLVENSSKETEKDCNISVSEELDESVNTPSSGSSKKHKKRNKNKRKSLND